MKAPPRLPRIVWGICLALGLVTLALYLPALRHDFLDYDDQAYVTENQQVQAGLTSAGLLWAFGPHVSNWHPATWLSHMLDCQLYGLKPGGHHFTSVLLHVVNTLVLFLVLWHITGREWRSAAVAALFAWHPLHVESVAWVSERKDVLSTFFALLTLGAYARYAGNAALEGKPGGGGAPAKGAAPGVGSGRSARFVWYGLALGCFALGLMSKPMVVTLPFLLLLLDYWPLERLPIGAESRKRLLVIGEKIPFLVLAAGCCALTLSAQQQAYSVVSTAGLPVAQRLAHALVAYAHYLGAALVPRHLAAYYPYDRNLSAAMVYGAGVLLLAITAGAVRLATRRPYLLVGWLWFLGSLVPMLGLVQVGDQAWADRYTYLPLIGLFIALVWGVTDAVAAAARLGGESVRGSRGRAPASNRDSARYGEGALPRRVRGALAAMAAAVSVALLAATTVQLSYWRNTRTLFEHAARVTQQNYLAVAMLGSLLAKEGKLDEALEQYDTALGWKPDYAEAHFLRGHALEQQGKLDSAIADYRQALWFKPLEEQTHFLLGAALARNQRYDEAAAQYQAVLKLKPDSATAHNNLARLRHSQGRLEEAIEHYTTALKLDPSLAEAHNNLGILLLQKGRVAEGATRLREALRLNPGNAETQYNLGLALNQQQQWQEAADLLGRTVGPGGTDPNAHYQFALALEHLERTREALSQYAQALLLQPDFIPALNGLAWLLATGPQPELRNGVEAVRMAEHACALTARKDAAKLKTLAAAYAEAGRFPEAVDTARAARQSALDAGRAELVTECQGLVDAFTAGKPWRTAK